ncbi:unnamed protein product [Polarella glacialis]|uniref:Protein kinase domain-containing protein n=1 Tax=Polarella glacialis TaxID=89957 RepID=A0A813LGK9_POLGL|nr:unnamed protein product [Polarella glacialis]
MSSASSLEGRLRGCLVSLPILRMLQTAQMVQTERMVRTAPTAPTSPVAIRDHRHPVSRTAATATSKQRLGFSAWSSPSTAPTRCDATSWACSSCKVIGKALFDQCVFALQSFMQYEQARARCTEMRTDFESYCIEGKCVGELAATTTSTSAIPQNTATIITTTAATTAARSNNNNSSSNSNSNNNNSTTTTITTTRAPTATAATTTPSTASLSKALLSTAGSLLCCVSLCFGVWLWRRSRAARYRQEAAAAAADMPKTIGDAATDLWGPESSVSVYVVDASGFSVADPSVESCSEGAFQSSDMQHILTIGIGEHWFIKPSDITPGPKSILGSGSFGIVVKGVLNYATEVAIQIPKIRFQSREESQLAKKMRLFRHIRHSNIVLFHGATLMVIDGGSPCLSLVLEWVNGGNFGEYMQQLRSNALFEVDGHAFAYKILLHVARGMTYLHKLTPVILHLDLKPANILVEKSVPPKGKITDFGLSRFARNSLPQPKVGTEKYMAPEVARRKPYGPAADVFSFGRSIIWTITGELCSELISSTSSKGQEDACIFQTLDEVASSCLEEEPYVRPHFFRCTTG